MRAAFIGFAIMLVLGASGSAAARAFILDAGPSPAPAAAPAETVPPRTDLKLAYQPE
jgi:hypothetical protein